MISRDALIDETFDSFPKPRLGEGRLVESGRTRSVGLDAGFEDIAADESGRSFHAILPLLETLMSYGRNTDPRATMLMVNAYLNASQQAIGIAFFETLLARHGHGMSDDVRAVYLAAYAILRATHADRVPLWRRIPWVWRTFEHLEEARRLTGGEHPILRWAAGLIYAQVPFFFFKKRQAYEDLTWLADRPETEPVFGFYREAYRQLARLYAKDGHEAEAGRYRALSGFDSYEPKAMLMGWFTSTKAGAAMAPRPVLREVVPGRIFALFGFGFSDIHFVLSDDGRELIAIDAGTQPQTLKAAHDFLLAHHPDLPKITTALITHAHWDHVGGHHYLRAYDPGITFYGRETYRTVVERVLRRHSYEQFRGADFDPAWVGDYAPDVEVDAPTTLTVGGTEFRLIPVPGGETEDAMLIHLPALSTVFVGDVVMPWYGEPWVAEGDLDAAIETMDKVLSLSAEHILHGHHPLTMLYGPASLPIFRDAFAWLIDTVRDHVSHGYGAKDIVRLNLVPPGLEDHAEAYLSYAAARDNVIARVADRMTGIWQEDVTGQEPAGLDQITSVEYGRMLGRYLGLSVGQTARVLRRMIDHGDNELALRLAIVAERQFGADRRLHDLKQEAADRLRSAAQFLDPFRFVTYTEMIGEEQRPMPAA